MPKSGAMKPWVSILAAIFAVAVNARAQTFAPTQIKPKPSPAPTMDLQTLAKKIDEQNAKIDMLSQQIFKLEQALAAASRPGVMIGEGASTLTSTSPTATPAAETSRTSGNGNSHIVARGETLTSIAKTYGVSVSDLQKLNHIDNPLKLQAGQTILIPVSPTPAPSASSSGE
jgi:LysM repeat protein